MVHASSLTNSMPLLRTIVRLIVCLLDGSGDVCFVGVGINVSLWRASGSLESFYDHTGETATK